MRYEVDVDERFQVLGHMWAAVIFHSTAIRSSEGIYSFYGLRLVHCQYFPVPPA